MARDTGGVPRSSGRTGESVGCGGAAIALRVGKRAVGVARGSRDFRGSGDAAGGSAAGAAAIAHLCAGRIGGRAAGSVAGMAVGAGGGLLPAHYRLHRIDHCGVRGKRARQAAPGRLDEPSGAGLAVDVVLASACPARLHRGHVGVGGLLCAAAALAMALLHQSGGGMVGRVERAHRLARDGVVADRHLSLRDVAAADVAGTECGGI